MKWSRVKLKCLFLISENKNLTGYDITKLTCDTHQLIYRELAALVKAGLLTFKTQQRTDKPDSNHFELTKKGEQFIAQYNESFPAKDLARLLSPQALCEICTLLPASIEFDYLVDISAALSEHLKSEQANTSAKCDSLPVVKSNLFAQLCMKELLAMFEDRIAHLNVENEPHDQP